MGCYLDEIQWIIELGNELLLIPESETRLTLPCGRCNILISGYCTVNSFTHFIFSFVEVNKQNVCINICFMSDQFSYVLTFQFKIESHRFQLEAFECKVGAMKLHTKLACKDSTKLNQALQEQNRKDFGRQSGDWR